MRNRLDGYAAFAIGSEHGRQYKISELEQPGRWYRQRRNTNGVAMFIANRKERVLRSTVVFQGHCGGSERWPEHPFDMKRKREECIDRPGCRTKPHEKICFECPGRSAIAGECKLNRVAGG